MTRKHFKLIAEVVASVDDKDIRNQIAVDFAHRFQDTNPRFDITRFLEACKCASR